MVSWHLPSQFNNWLRTCFIMQPKLLVVDDVGSNPNNPEELAEMSVPFDVMISLPRKDRFVIFLSILLRFFFLLYATWHVNPLHQLSIEVCWYPFLLPAGSRHCESKVLHWERNTRISRDFQLASSDLQTSELTTRAQLFKGSIKLSNW